MIGVGLSDFSLKRVMRSRVRDALPVPGGKERFEQTELTKFPRLLL